MGSLADSLSSWHNFYSLIGSAAATLIGLMFVAASIGAGLFTREHQIGVRSFLSPTVVHFSAVLAICLLASIPDPQWLTLGSMTIVIGIAGLTYSVYVLSRMIKYGMGTIDFADRLWYTLLPIVSYLCLMLAGIGFVRHVNHVDLLALSIVVLLSAGIRNAWDITIWIIDRRGG